MHGPGPSLITRIVVRPKARGRGWGSEVLRDVCMDADAEGITLMLQVQPNPAGLAAEALTAWYQRHGFEAVPGTDTMVRKPAPRTPCSS
ncbi:GNAT family N-acetyltransferase [Streptomyces sp. P1-3]|uniref:GNAT family N-acetyltransferase n=1 Tax=Streptomyces sp. P1-3 TaxID=3421658 RepID=UPI003D36140B